MFSCEFENLIRQLCYEYFLMLCGYLNFKITSSSCSLSFSNQRTPIELENGLLQLFQKHPRNNSIHERKGMKTLIACDIWFLLCI